MKHLRRLSILLCVALSATSLFAQRSWSSEDYVKIDINSGNPTFPYPQFKEYKTGKSLAKYNPEGVTHADMEKTGREAYEIMSHRCRYDGGTHCGVPYITFNNFVKFGKDNLPYGAAEYCTEGDGYMMLASAIFADQPTFNGLWMYIHDNKIPGVIRYQDGEERFPDYEFQKGLPGWSAKEDKNTTSDLGSATDGDEDIAMALLIAYKQWGEFMYQDGKQVLDSQGNPISYKKAAEDIIKAMVDTATYYSINGDGTLYNGGHMSGDIGVDGYVKGGNRGAELTYWRSNQTTYPDISKFSNVGGYGGDGNTHTDYCAPAYYNEFAKWLESGDVKATEWQINQFKRAEASSDYLCGEAYRQGLYPSLGTTNIDTKGNVSFTNFNSGEDFRTAWRLAQNYLWHGNPTSTWNPDTHQVVSDSSNTYEYDMAIRWANFLKNPANACSQPGVSPNPKTPKWFGPAKIKMCYYSNGEEMAHYSSNYTLGCAAPSAVASGDVDFVADLYRQSELIWEDASIDTDTDDERYIESMPKYFHGWFRVLPLLIHTGNWHAPSDMKSESNLKCYLAVDKTYASYNDTITYTVTYRNYGSKDAENVVVTLPLDKNYQFVSASAGGTFKDGKISWNIDKVSGFKSGKLDATTGSLTVKVLAQNTETARISLKAEIAENGKVVWESNEYPNNATYTMERNTVDLVDDMVRIYKMFDKDTLKPSDTMDVKLLLVNNGQQWLDGGRDNVRFSYGNNMTMSYNLYQFFRIWHDAQEAYINTGNYRVSYYLSDTTNVGLYDKETNPNGWQLALDNAIDLKKWGWMGEDENVKVEYEVLPVSEDDNGKCNQRLIQYFPKQLMATNSHIYENLQRKYEIHKGGDGPLFYRTNLKPASFVEMINLVKDDWSYDASVAYQMPDGLLEIGTLVSPCWANYNDKGYPVDNYSRYVCDDQVDKTFDRILVEEFDGYTWRRILGNGFPTLGVENVVATDTIPAGFEFVAFSDSTAFGQTAEFVPAPDGAEYAGVVRCSVPKVLNGTNDMLNYSVRVKESDNIKGEQTVNSNATATSSKHEVTRFYPITVLYPAATGINNADATASYSVTSNDGKLTVTFSDSDKHLVVVTNASGVVLNSAESKGEFTTKLQSGVYLLTVDGKTQKVIVK